MKVTKCVMKIEGSVLGDPTNHDGKYLVEFIAARMDGRGAYLPGGKLVTSHDIARAKVFDDAGAALEVWRTANGIRPDGQPNRPLTSYTVSIERAP